MNYQIVVLQCNYNIIKWSEEKFRNNYIHTVTMVTLLIWVKFHIGYMHKTKTFLHEIMTYVTSNILVTLAHDQQEMPLIRLKNASREAENPQFLDCNHVMKRPYWLSKQWQNVAQGLHNNTVKFSIEFFVNMAAGKSHASHQYCFFMTNGNTVRLICLI